MKVIKYFLLIRRVKIMKQSIDVERVEFQIKELQVCIDTYINSFEKIKSIMKLFDDVEHQRNLRINSIFEKHCELTAENEKFQSLIKSFVKDVELYITICKTIPETTKERISLNE